MAFKILSETYFVVAVPEGGYIGGSVRYGALSYRTVATAEEAIKFASHRGAKRVSNKQPGSRVETISIPTA